MSRLLKMIGLFCKRALFKRPYSAKETYNLKEPPNRNPPHMCIHLACKGQQFVVVATPQCRKFSGGQYSRKLKAQLQSELILSVVLTGHLAQVTTAASVQS